MVKTRGVTLVALATLLAGFVASCASTSDAPSVDHINTESNVIQVQDESDDDDEDASLVDLVEHTPTPAPAVVIDPTPTQSPQSISTEPTSTPRPKPAQTPIPEPTSTPSDPDPVVLAKLDRPNITTERGIHYGEVAVVVHNNEPDSLLRYTLDGSDPSATNGFDYNEPVIIDSAGVTTLRVISVREGMRDSDIEEAGFRVLSTMVESSEPIILSGDDVLEITDVHYQHRGPITLSGNAKLIITDSVLTHVKDFSFEHELKATENSEVVVVNSGIDTVCTGSFNWSFFDNSKLTVDGMDPSHTQCNTWNFMSGTSQVDVTNWRTFSGTVCDSTSVAIKDSTDMEIELCMPWPTIMDAELPLEVTDYVFDPGENSTIDYQLSMSNSTIDGWGINVGPGSDITIRNTPSVTVGVGIGLPSVRETMVADGIKSGHWEDQTWDFGAGAKLRLVNTYTYGWELNAWGGNTMVVRNSDYSGSSVNSGDSSYVIEDTTADLLVAFEEVSMTVSNSVITGIVVANDHTVITITDSVIGVDPSTLEDASNNGNVFVRGNGKIILKNTLVYGEHSIEDNGEIIIE